MVATETMGTVQGMFFWSDLTPKERLVGAAMAEGWANATIADRLALSRKTVENRVSAIYEKLPDVAGVDRRVHAVLLIRSVLG